MASKKKSPIGLVDFRGEDWSTHDFSKWGDREQEKFRGAISALHDLAVAEATYQLINFGQSHPHRSLTEYAAATWLMDAYTAAFILGKLPVAAGDAPPVTSSRKRIPPGLIDYRNADWSDYDLSTCIDHNRPKLQSAIAALDDPSVGEATYRLVNFGAAYSERTVREHPDFAWLSAAHTAAFVLGKLRAQ